MKLALHWSVVGLLLVDRQKKLLILLFRLTAKLTKTNSKKFDVSLLLLEHLYTLYLQNN